MAERADFVIIGGGVVGCSIAYNLARRRAGRIILLEQASIGSGSSTRAAGGIRTQYSTKVNLDWSVTAAQLFETFREEMGADPQWRRYGYLFLAGSDAQDRIIRSTAAQLRERGVPVETLAADEVERAFPGLRTAGVTTATFTPQDGYASVHAVLQAFARRARDLGADIREGTPVTGIGIEGGRVRSVVTPDGTIEAGAVIIAAGAWSGRVAALAGVDLPVRPIRRELFYSGPLGGLPERFPWVVDLAAGWYLRHEERGVLLSGRLASQPSFSTVVEAEPPADTVASVTRRLPAVREATWPHRWAGVLETTPDYHAVVGPVPGVAGAWLCCGFSGHGFMHSPVAGRVMAEWLLDGAAVTADPSALSPERFAAGELIREELHQAPA